MVVIEPYALRGRCRRLERILRNRASTLVVWLDGKTDWKNDGQTKAPADRPGTFFMSQNLRLAKARTPMPGNRTSSLL
jgi:hypothetical protein